MGPDVYDNHCPVPLKTLGTLYRADGFVVAELLDTIQEETRACLAVYLYGRSHTHALGHPSRRDVRELGATGCLRRRWRHPLRPVAEATHRAQRWELSQAQHQPRWPSRRRQNDRLGCSLTV